MNLRFFTSHWTVVWTDSERRFMLEKMRFLAGARNDKPDYGMTKGKRRRFVQANRLLFPHPDKTELSFRMERSAMRNLPKVLCSYYMMANILFGNSG
jgi:hypothetical protein